MVTFVAISTLLLALVAIAIYALVESSKLSLPTSLGLSILTVLLPFTAWASVFGARVYRRFVVPSSSKSGAGGGGLLQHPLVPFVLQVLQGIASVVLATLWSQGMVSSGQPAGDCYLQTTWRRLWMAHDGRSLEGIQNAFGCCGFNSVRDMAWPSPRGNVGLCSEMHNRYTSCVAPWRDTLRRLSGFEFGVALGCAMIQFFYIARTLHRIFREAAENMARRNRNNAAALEEGPDASLVRRAPGAGGGGGGGGNNNHNNNSYHTMGHTYEAAHDADPEALDGDAEEYVDRDTARLLRNNSNR